jgi:NAD(P)-dependent dehydrogenase (short-subunit alcohol dehydrogenase family)
MGERFDLTDKIAIVTGGTRGIGLTLARGLKESGAKVIVTDVARHGGDETKGFHFIKCDNRRMEEIVAMVNEVFDKFKRIDILVNNVGISFKKPAVETEVHEWEEVLRVNVTGTFLVTKEVAKIMLKQKKGRIINIGSNFGSIGKANFSAYCVSKAAVIHMSRVLALEWAKEGIRVNTVSPAMTRTDMAKRTLEDPSSRSYFENNFPIGRVLETEDLVGAVVFLSSDSSEMVTGHNLNVDGGYLCQ